MVKLAYIISLARVTLACVTALLTDSENTTIYLLLQHNPSLLPPPHSQRACRVGTAETDLKAVSGSGDVAAV